MQHVAHPEDVQCNRCRKWSSFYEVKRLPDGYDYDMGTGIIKQVARLEVLCAECVRGESLMNAEQPKEVRPAR